MFKRILLFCCAFFVVSLAANESAMQIEIDELKRSMQELQDTMETLLEDEIPTIIALSSLPNMERASLGLFLEKSDDDELVVIGFTPNANAEAQGMAKGDVLIAIDDEDLTGANANVETLIEYLSKIKPGANVTLAIERNGVPIDQIIETQEYSRFDRWDSRGIEIERGGPFQRFGKGMRNQFDRIRGAWRRDNQGDVSVTDVNKELGSYFGVEAGVLVLETRKRSQLKPGDVIIAIGEEEIANTEELYEELKSSSAPVSVQRDGAVIELSIDETLDGLRIERELRFLSRQQQNRKQRVW